MNYRWILMVCLFCSCAVAKVKSPDRIWVSVDVERVPQYGLTVFCPGGKMHGFRFDEKKHAEYVLDDREAAILTFQHGFQERKQMYVERGDSLRLSYDGNSLQNTLKSNDSRPAITAYLAKAKITDLSRRDYALEFPAFLARLKEQEILNGKLLDSCRDELVKESDRFVRLERNRIKYTLGSALFNYPAMHAKIANREYVPDDSYYAAVRELFREDSELLCLEEYRKVLFAAVDVFVQREEAVYDLYPRTMKQMEYIQEHFKDEALKQELLFILAQGHIARYGIRNSGELDELYRHYVTDKKLLARYRAVYDSWAAIAPGAEAIAFHGEDAAEKSYSLKDFKGRNVCIYLWLNLHPCMQQFERLKQLQPLFEEKNVALVNLYLEDGREGWEKAIGNKQVQCGLHLFSDDVASFLKAYHYESHKVFQLILIDGKGRIVESHVPPMELEEMLKRL